VLQDVNPNSRTQFFAKPLAGGSIDDLIYGEIVTIRILAVKQRRCDPNFIGNLYSRMLDGFH